MKDSVGMGMGLGVGAGAGRESAFSFAAIPPRPVGEARHRDSSRRSEFENTCQKSGTVLSRRNFVMTEACGEGR